MPEEPENRHQLMGWLNLSVHEAKILNTYLDNQEYRAGILEGLLKDVLVLDFDARGSCLTDELRSAIYKATHPGEDEDE